MEIKNVTNENKMKYPTKKQIKKEKILDNIPSKWRKIGISSLVMMMIMKGTSLAVDPASHIYPIEGDTSGIEMTPFTKIKIFGTLTLPFIIFIITGVIILINKFKARKQVNSKKTKRWVEILCAISAIICAIEIWWGFIMPYID